MVLGIEPIRKETSLELNDNGFWELSGTVRRLVESRASCCNAKKKNADMCAPIKSCVGARLN